MILVSDGLRGLVLAAAGDPIDGSFLTPVGEHELLLFWVQLAVLLGVARLLGGLMRRFGQPAVIGELGAGLLVGPSVLGRVAPDVAAWLFPGGVVESAMLLAVAWLGIFLLLIVTGFETDLGLLRRLGRPAVNVSTGSLILPLGLGLGLGWVMPAMFFGEAGGRLGFALFMGVAMSISALPVVAKILSDMGLMRRNFGQITVAAGMANDLVGWLLLGAVVGIFTAGEVDLANLAITLGAVTAFIAAAMTVGQKMTDGWLRFAQGQQDSFTGAMTATMIVALVFGAITQWIGVEAVLGALVAGIVLNRSKYQREDVEQTLETLSNAIFAPVFFATAGLYVDFLIVLEGNNWIWTLVVIAVAALGKLGGSYAGARLSGLPRMEGLAIGLGLNARGALEIVVATLGLSLGALNDASYAMIVVMAMVTSMAAPPLLRPVLRRLTAAPDEAARLEREELLSRSVIAAADHVLLPTRGGENSVAAARLLDLSLQPGASVTVLTVDSPGEDNLLREKVISERVLPALVDHEVERRRHQSEDVATDILAEAALGYELMVIGLTEDFVSTHELSPVLRRIIAGTPVPLLLVRHSRDRRPAAELDREAIRRILVPITGTRIGRAAEEIAYVLGSRLDSEVDAVHVVADSTTGSPRAVEGQLARSRELATQFGRGAIVATRTGVSQHEELLRAANDYSSDLIVIGALTRPGDPDSPFLGYGAEYLLERADATVVAVVFPNEQT